MKKILAITIVLTFALLGPVRADQAQQRALAEQLLDAMQMQKTIEKSYEMIKKMIPAQMEQTKTYLDQTLDQGEDSKIDTQIIVDGATSQTIEIMEIIMEDLSWDKLKDDYITIYAEVFTAEELSELVTFYNSPIGRKYTEKQPEIMQRTMEISQKKMMDIMPKIMKLSEEMTKKLTEDMMQEATKEKQEDQKQKDAAREMQELLESSTESTLP